jgi:hypothetical protein
MQQPPETPSDEPPGWNRPLRLTLVKPHLVGGYGLLVPHELVIPILTAGLIPWGLGHWVLALCLCGVLWLLAAGLTFLEPYWLEIAKQIAGTALSRMVRTRGRFGNPFKYIAPR